MNITVKNSFLFFFIILLIASIAFIKTLSANMFNYQPLAKIKYNNQTYNYILEINPYIEESIYINKLLAQQTKKYKITSEAIVMIKINNNTTQNNLAIIEKETNILIDTLQQKLNIANIKLLQYSDNTINNYNIILYLKK